MMLTQTLLTEMTGRIVRNFKPVQVILFGSQARGDAAQLSDVDLLVVLPETANRREAAIEIRRVLASIPVAKDILVTTPDEIRQRGSLVGTVLRSALKEGKVIYERGRKV